jgi:hypothetical protein
MFKKTQTLLILIVLLLGYSPLEAEAQEKNGLAYFEFVPDSWRSEIIRFPLDFAPTLAYQGKLELLFSPGMFDEKSEEFLSYGFVWAIEGTEIPSTEQLEQDLKTYYYGLQQIVSDNALTAPTSSKVWISKTSLGSDNISYVGEIKWTEPFVTRQSQTLKFTVTFSVDAEQKQWLGFFRVSPQIMDHTIWETLNTLPVKWD